MSMIRILDLDGQVLVEIDPTTGDVKLRSEADAPRAAKVFWSCVSETIRGASSVELAGATDLRSLDASLVPTKVRETMKQATSDALAKFAKHLRTCQEEIPKPARRGVSWAADEADRMAQLILIKHDQDHIQ